jgi:hypothetical protein
MDWLAIQQSIGLLQAFYMDGCRIYKRRAAKAAGFYKSSVPLFISF